MRKCIKLLKELWQSVGDVIVIFFGDDDCNLDSLQECVFKGVVNKINVKMIFVGENLKIMIE